MKVRDVVVWFRERIPAECGVLRLVVPAGVDGEPGSVVQSPKMPKDGVDFYASGIHLYPITGEILFIPYACIAWVEVGREREQA